MGLMSKDAVSVKLLSFLSFFVTDTHKNVFNPSPTIRFPKQKIVFLVKYITKPNLKLKAKV